MRLACPNCDAEYEVDASVIPDTGRDVQCSNCGHAWFQLPPEVEAEMAAEEALYDAPPAALAASPAIKSSGPDLPAPTEPPRRSIDESVLAVLKEEAERETEARKAETAPVIETQTEMSLPAEARTGLAGAVSRRIAKLKGVEAEPEKPLSRREMLPEIEELNSTLRSSGEKRSSGAVAVSDPYAEARPKSSGFRSGFTLIILIALILAAIYLMAPKLAEQFPAAAAPLKTYVGIVDQLRLDLDGLINSAVGTLNGWIGKKI